MQITISILRSSWARLGPSWGRLGDVLGRLGSVLGLSWAVLGASWAILGCLGPPWAVKKSLGSKRGTHFGHQTSRLALNKYGFTEAKRRFLKIRKNQINQSNNRYNHLWEVLSLDIAALWGPWETTISKDTY